MNEKRYLEAESLKEAMWKNFYKEEDKWESTPEAEFLDVRGGCPRHWFQLGFGAGLDAVVKAEPVPHGHMHDSGFMCMDFVGVKPDGERVRFGSGCDSVAFCGSHFCMECMPDGTIRIFNHLGFTVSEDLSTIIFYEKRKEVNDER